MGQPSMMRVDCSLRAAPGSPISFSAPVSSVRDTDEPHDAFEKRTWRERLHTDSEGQVYIPPMALKKSLAEVALFMSETVPGKGPSKYTKHFDAGTPVTDPLYLGVSSEEVEGEWLFVPSDGKRGGSKRVWKCFPYVNDWKAVGTIYLLDPALIARPEKVEEYLRHAGKFIGLGRFAPRRGGFYGRFVVDDFQTEAIQEAA